VLPKKAEVIADVEEALLNPKWPQVPMKYLVKHHLAYRSNEPVPTRKILFKLLNDDSVSP